MAEPPSRLAKRHEIKRNRYRERSMLLAGDVGGTKTRLGLFEPHGKTTKRLAVERYESGKFDSLEEIIKTFLDQHKARPKVACFGIPGPVIEGRVKVTNLPWELSERSISDSLDIPKVKLVNDLVATAAAIPAFTEKEILTLHRGNPPVGDGVAAVVAPGTGLGQAFLYQDGGRNYFLASEGGHSNFAPTNEIEFELHAFITRRYGHASVERVLCGPGLVNIYEFLKEGGHAEEPLELSEKMRTELPTAVIASTGQEGTYPITKMALEMFISILGAHASNVMITVLATKGVYLGGGIPPRIIEKLQEGGIMKSYLDKGKMARQVEAAPLHVIKDDHAALLGAAEIAFSLS
ncbi:MAG: glucokinase [Deltaproteobacteria bacterium]|nr:glucokinase [Deltaproteobacteria bacterium]